MQVEKTSAMPHPSPTKVPMDGGAATSPERRGDMHRRRRQISATGSAPRRCERTGWRRGRPPGI